MHYRLGQFGQFTLSPARFEELLASWKSRVTPEQFERMRTALLEMTTQHLPELRTELASDSERRWLDVLHDRLVDLQGTIDIQFLECCYRPGSDGFLCVSATSPSVRAQVRPGDFIQAGFIAFHRSGRPFQLSTRVFRLICSNGSVEKLLEQDPALVEVESIGKVLGRCFDRQILADVAERFAEATRRPAPTRQEWLDLAKRLMTRHGAVARGWLDEARELLDEIDDPTEWDFLNALTEVARERPDWPERYDLEEAAGAFARLRRPAEHPVMSHAELIPS